MKNRSILISGAGIAGPALAYWLHRYGFHPIVVERASGPRSGGHAVDIRGTAREVAARMGIVSQVRAAGTGARGMAFVNGEGRRVARMGTDVFGHSGGPVAELSRYSTGNATRRAGSPPSPSSWPDSTTSRTTVDHSSPSRARSRCTSSATPRRKWIPRGRSWPRVGRRVRVVR